MAVALGSDEFQPASAFKFLLEADGVSNLLELQLNHFIVLVSIRVHVREDIMCAVDLAFRNEPTWRFRNEQDTEKERDSGDEGRTQLQAPGNGTGILRHVSQPFVPVHRLPHVP